MAADKNRIQALVNGYLEKFGKIDILLPDGVEVAIGITQETKKGIEKVKDYCWIETKRENRSVSFDRYEMSLNFDRNENRVIDYDSSCNGVVSVF